METTKTDHTRMFAGAVRSVFGPNATATQRDLTDTVLERFFRCDLRWETAEAITADQIAEVVGDGKDRHFLITLLILIEMCGAGRTDGEAYADALESLAHDLDVVEDQLLVGRDAAVGDLEKLEEDWQRLKPDLVDDPAIMEDDPGAAAALARIATCQPGTVGHALHDFYVRQNHPDPGHPDFGPLRLTVHDTHHVIGSYGTVPEEEIALQAMLVAMTSDTKHLSGLTAAFALNQLGAMRGVFGELEPQCGFLGKTAVRDLLVDGLVRGRQTRADFSALDVLAILDEPLEELRRQHGVVPRPDEPVYVASLASVTKD